MISTQGGDEELLRQRVANAEGHGEVISEQTARAIARWFARAIGPGFQGFLIGGLVTQQFYRELGYLYDQRRAEVEHWLNALVRYSLRQPTVELPDAGQEGQPEEHGQ